MVRRKDPDRPLTSEAAAQRLRIAVGDVPDLGHRWTEGDVAETKRSRPDWLAAARQAYSAARAQVEQDRRDRLAAFEARRADFTCPTVSAKDSEFAAEFAAAILLANLYDAFDASAADIEVQDYGYDISTRAHTVTETNRERASRGISLSGLDEEWCREYGTYRQPGTLGDLFDAPTGNTIATYVPGAGLAAESWSGAWLDEWGSVERLALASVVAGLVLADATDVLEMIAGRMLADVDRAPRLTFENIPSDLLSLASEALYEWSESVGTVLDPDDIVDMDAPLAALPAMVQATRHDWTRTERLALSIAGLDPIQRLNLADL